MKQIYKITEKHKARIERIIHHGIVENYRKRSDEKDADSDQARKKKTDFPFSVSPCFMLFLHLKTFFILSVFIDVRGNTILDNVRNFFGCLLSAEVSTGFLGNYG